ncbi:unnamed protein product [Caenorhabditis bovis]|uniref:Importin subunit alpha n=1 Tax=Caenorhabditis bovis TaxID=2654633 RepID=A0A8S1F9G0_9PELO|nr:unnamed protein product [Caenorhabditis bovis]
MPLTDAKNEANEERDDGRLTQYKNLSKHDELRRRRTECSVEIRKQKGADMMMKRRNIVDFDDDENEKSLDTVDIENVKPASTPARLSNDEVKRILSNNPSTDDMIVCFESLRRSLSKNKNPPIDEVIKTGLVHALVQALALDNTKILYEAAWALTNIVSGTSAQTIAAVEAGATAPLVKLSIHDDPQIAEQALWAVANIAGDSAELRDFVINCHGIEALMHLMSKLDTLSVSHVRTIAWTFSNMCRHKNPHAPLEVLRVLSFGLTKLVQHKDQQVRQDACWAVSYLTDGPDEQIEIARQSGVLQEIMKFFRSEESLVAPALRTLGNVATGNDSLTQTVIDLGTLNEILPLFERTSTTSIVKECCWLVSNVIAGTQGQIQAVIDAGLIPVIVSVLKSGDYKCQFEASWALSNLAQGGTAKQIFAMVEEDAIPALCNLLSQSNPDMLNNALETIYTALLTVSATYPQRMDAIRDQIEECGGIDQLERLQESQSETIYAHAYRIISQFFADDDAAEEEASENQPPGTYNF